MKSIDAFSAAFIFSVTLSGTLQASPLLAQEDSDDSIVTAAQNDCHQDVRRHFLPEYGRRVWHRHRQSDCKVVLADPDDADDNLRDCHRDVRKHYLPEYGRSLYHRHVGERCGISVYNEYKDTQPGKPCLRIGPLTLCETKN